MRVFGSRDDALAYPMLSQNPPGKDSSDPAPRMSYTSTIGMGNTPVSEVMNRLLGAGEEDLRLANARWQIIRDHLQGNSPTTLPRRTLRRWLSSYRDAERLWSSGYVGLLPKRRPGNSTPRFLEEATRLMQEVIESQYETKKQTNRYACWIWLQQACDREGLRPPSYVTFCTAVRKRAGFEQTSKRMGHRAAYSQQPFYLELELKTPRHGDRPFEICHVDHTELDIELVCSHTRRNLGRPWYTILTDAFSRRLLAIFLTFDPPSYRSCMMVLRECVRRHERFPQSLVVDGGKEFESVYFDTLLARFECTKKTRPPAKARFGSVCERLFGTSNTRLIHNLPGNTQIMRNVRQVTRSVDPRRNAEWTLGELYRCLCQWAYEIYDTISHPALGQSPREAFTAGLMQSGNRAHRTVTYDEAFRLLTLPTTARGQARVMPGKGAKINHVFYWAAALRDPAVEQTLVPVRYDPYDAGIAYVYVRNRWVQCVSEHYSVLRGKSEHELMLATAELRRRAQQHSGEFTVTAKKLVDFLSSAEAEHVLQVQRSRDREGRDVLTQIQAGVRKPSRNTDCVGGMVSDAKESASLERKNSVKTLTPDELTVYEEY